MIPNNPSIAIARAINGRTCETSPANPLQPALLQRDRHDGLALDLAVIGAAADAIVGA